MNYILAMRISKDLFDDLALLLMEQNVIMLRHFGEGEGYLNDFFAEEIERKSNIK